MADGWKFRQLIRIGSSSNYGNKDQAEFLSVLSRELNNSTNGFVIQPSEKAKVLQERGSQILTPESSVMQVQPTRAPL